MNDMMASSAEEEEQKSLERGGGHHHIITSSLSFIRTSTFLPFFFSSFLHDFLHLPLLFLSLLSAALDYPAALPRAATTLAALCLMCLLSAASDCYQSRLFRGLHTHVYTPAAARLVVVDHDYGADLDPATAYHQDSYEAGANVDVDDETSPLQATMTRIAIATGKMGFVVTSLVFMCLTFYHLGFIFKHLYLTTMSTLLGIAIVALALLVIMVPEGLPLATTLSSAASLTQLRHHGVIARNLRSLETLGIATTVCIDQSLLLLDDSYRGCSCGRQDDEGSLAKDGAPPSYKYVEKLRSNDVKMVMVSREGLSSAIATARRMCILRNGDGLAIESSEFREWGEKERLEKIRRVAVLARAGESDKLMFVKALQQVAGEVVAVVASATTATTGGGDTNDEEAAAVSLLSAADVGIVAAATSLEGELNKTDGVAAAAQRNCDMMMLAGGGAISVSALLWEAVLSSRRMYLRVQNLLEFVVTGNAALAVVMLVWAVAKGEAPVTAAELLWTNVLMDVVAAAAIMMAGGRKRSKTKGSDGGSHGAAAEIQKEVAREVIRRRNDHEAPTHEGSLLSLLCSMVWRCNGGAVIVRAAMLVCLSFATMTPKTRAAASSPYCRYNEGGSMVFNTFILCEAMELLLCRTDIVVIAMGALRRPSRWSPLALLGVSCILVFLAGLMLLLGRRPWRELLVCMVVATLTLCVEELQGYVEAWLVPHPKRELFTHNLIEAPFTCIITTT